MENMVAVSIYIMQPTLAHGQKIAVFRPDGDYKFMLELRTMDIDEDLGKTITPDIAPHA